jgi:hypothetical protein
MRRQPGASNRARPPPRGAPSASAGRPLAKLAAASGQSLDGPAGRLRPLIGRRRPSAASPLAERGLSLLAGRT